MLGKNVVAFEIGFITIIGLLETSIIGLCQTLSFTLHAKGNDVIFGGQNLVAYRRQASPLRTFLIIAALIRLSLILN